MEVSLSGGRHIVSVTPDNISMAFQQTPQRTGKTIFMYFLDENKMVGRIRFTPTEFSIFAKQGLDLLAENKVRV